METQHLDNLAKELASKYKSKAALFGKDGAVNTLIQKTLQAALAGELTDHLGYHKHQTRTGTNARNGYVLAPFLGPVISRDSCVSLA